MGVSNIKYTAVCRRGSATFGEPAGLVVVGGLRRTETIRRTPQLNLALVKWAERDVPCVKSLGDLVLMAGTLSGLSSRASPLKP
jgi:hypothetical protein